jgi:leucyl aminopeptidase
VTTLRASATDPARVRTDVLVVGLHQGVDKKPELAAGTASVDAAFGRKLAQSFAAAGATGSHGEITRLPGGATAATTVLGVGLGKTGEPPTADALRRAAGAAARALTDTERAATTLAQSAGPDGVEAAVAAVAEGLLLGAYSFDTFRSKTKAGSKSPVGSVTLLVTEPRAASAAITRAAIIADSVALARDLVNTPPDALPPAEFARRGGEAAKAAGLTVQILDEKALARGGYGGILGVGQGSTRPPRLLKVARAAPAGAPTVALVGKGITFDSGGLSLKPAKSMETMKSDMAGAAAVLATAIAAARLNLEVGVTAWCPLAENMPGGGAIRPSDVLKMYGGRTVEVLNTDAEGRLVLADAIVRASEDGPALLLDVATLTGAQIVALGNRTYGVMGTDSLRDRVLAAAEKAGDNAWPMPLPAELRPPLDSEVADLRNIGDPAGGMLSAGLFLKEFVPDELPWAHLDIAGPSFNSAGPWGYTPKGGTGVPVATLVNLLEKVAEDGPVLLAEGRKSKAKAVRRPVKKAAAARARARV